MTPQTPEFDLLPYQAVGRDWLASQSRTLLGDDMGVGKSAQAIAAADKVAARDILVVCPAVARINWAREFDRFSLFKRTQRVLLSGEPPALDDQLVIVSFDLLLNDKVFAPLVARQWGALIVDEAHFLKEPSAERTKRVIGKDGLIHRAKHFWAMSGTFAPNHVGELWLWAYVLGHTTLTQELFLRKYCKTQSTPYGLKVIGNNPGALPKLREGIKRMMLRRTKEEVMPELPPLTLSEITVEPGPVDLELWFFDYWMGGGDAAVMKAVRNQEDKLHTAWTSVAGTNSPDNSRLQILPGMDESVSVLRRYVGMQKLFPVVDLIVAELGAGLDKLIVFALHRDVIVNLRDELKRRNIDAVILFGGTPPDKRQRNIDRFQNDKRCKVFIGNIKACGVAITLTAANEVLVVEPSWVPAENAQAIMRAHRKGQTRPVRCRFVSVEGSLDIDIQRVLRRKTKAILEAFD